MENQAIMEALDTLSGSQASAYITIDGNRYCFMQMSEFTANMEVSVTEVPILGRTGKGHKPAGWTGTWSAKAYFNQSIIRLMLLEYKKTGKLKYFEIQVSNEDATTTVGRQTVVLKQCLTKGGVLAILNANSETLSEDISGTFDDWEMPETFTNLAGME